MTLLLTWVGANAMVVGAWFWICIRRDRLRARADAAFHEEYRLVVEQSKT